MDMINPSNLKKVKEITAGFVFCLCLIGLIGNLVFNGPLINIITIILVSIIFLLTVLIKSQSKILYIIQVVVILVIGVFTLITGNTSQYLGDIIILSSFLLAYTYRIIKSYSYISILPIILLIVLLKTFFIKEDIVISLVSASFVLFIWTLLKNELTQYVRESQKNESLARIGLNAGNFIHNLHLATAIKMIKWTKVSLEEGDLEDVKDKLIRLTNWAEEKKKMRNNIMVAIDNNNSTIEELIDVNRMINSVLETVHFDEEAFIKVGIETEFCCRDIFLKAVPFEIYFILQNIISNAVESMLKKETQTRLPLKVTTSVESQKMIITISDCGMGFPVKNGKIVLKSSKPYGGFGLKYIENLLRNYKGTIEYRNKEEGGALVKLTFPQDDKRILVTFRSEEEIAKEEAAI